MIKNKKITKIATAAIFSILFASQAEAGVITFKRDNKVKKTDAKGTYITGTVHKVGDKIRKAKIYISRTEKGKQGFKFDRILKRNNKFYFDDKNEARANYFWKNLFYLDHTPSHKKKYTHKKKKHGPKNQTSRLFPKYQDLFQPILGVSENTFRKNTGKYKKEIKKYAGKYSTHTYRDLKNQYHMAQGNKRDGFLRTIRGHSVQKIIADPSKVPGIDPRDYNLSKAAFQSASTVAGLEGGMHKPQSYLSNMQPHAVQGETLSWCLAYGIIDRKYYHKVNNYLPGLVKFYNEAIPVHKFDYRRNIDDIKIGIQRNTTIAYEGDMKQFSNQKGYFSPKLNKLLPYLKRAKGQRRTNQIIAFALNFGKKRLGKYKYKEEFAKAVLKRQYLMTIWIAHYYGIKTVFLTNLGGGAFKNDQKWIDDAINNKELKNFIKTHGMRVYLVKP